MSDPNGYPCETVQQTLAKPCYMWKTQPPKSPLSGGLVTQFPPDKGDLSLNSPLIRGVRGVRNDKCWVFCTVPCVTMQNQHTTAMDGMDNMDSGSYTQIVSVYEAICDDTFDNGREFSWHNALAKRRRD